MNPDGRELLTVGQQHDIGDWDLAFAYEAIARAHAIAGKAGLESIPVEPASGDRDARLNRG